MKRNHYWYGLFAGALLFTSTVAFSVVYHTYPAHAISDVSEWTERTLLITLTAGYHEDASEAANVRRHYMAAAWWPMQAFFRDKLMLTRDKQLVLHPRPIVPSVIVTVKCEGEGVNCWRVRQAFFIPELQGQVVFNVLVVTADPAHGTPFLIKRLDTTLISY